MDQQNKKDGVTIMDLKSKKVFVTGADGFIGSHLCEELVKEGARVRALVQYNSQKNIGNLSFLGPKLRTKIEIVFGDIQDPELMKKFVKGCEVVFHLAALIAIPYSYLAPDAYVQTNILGTLHILQACRANKVKKLLHTSTSETYGTALYTPIDEKHPLQAQSPYSATKIGADKLCESFYRSFALPVVIVRPFNTYGPRQSDRAIIPTIISQLAAGKKELRIGATSPVRDFLYVKDNVRGYIEIAKSGKGDGEVLNLGTGSGITIGDLTVKIMQLMDHEVKIICENERKRPAKSEVKKLLCSNKKVKNIIGWSPKYSLKEGLLETIAYIKNNPNKFHPDAYNI